MYRFFWSGLFLWTSLLIPKVIVSGTQCGELIQFDSGYGEMTVFAESPGTSRKCVYYLLLWGNSSPGTAVQRLSPNCGPVTFLDHDVGLPFTYGSDYQFQYAEFTLDTSIDTGIASCITTGSSIELYGPTCVSDNIQTTIADNENMSVFYTVGKGYMLCRFVVADQERFGSCTDRFYIPYPGSSPFRVQLTVWASGNVNDIPPSCSVLTSPAAVPTYNCYDLQYTLLPGGVYSFSIAGVPPATGACSLVSDFYGTKTIEFPCASSIQLTIDDLATIFSTDEIVAGGSLSLVWIFSNGGFSCSSSVLTVSNLEAPVVFSVASDGAHVTVTLEANPGAVLTTVTNLRCQAVVLSCDGTDFAPNSVLFSSCANSQYVSIDLTGYSNCNIVVEFYSNDAPSDILTTSDTVSISVAIAPLWGAAPAPTVVPYGADGCMLLSWSEPAQTGGSVIESYSVDRMNGTGTFYLEVADNIVTNELLQCGFLAGVQYSFHVIAFNRAGGSLSTELAGILPEYFFAAPGSVYVDPSAASVTAGSGPPVFDIQQRNPDGDNTDDTAPNNRVFVGRLVNRGKLDAAKTGFVPLELGDTDYTALPLPLLANAPPAFTVTASAPGLGIYAVSASVTLAGPFSLASYSLESGGLLGQYWSNPFLEGVPDLQQKDIGVDFSWDDQIYTTASGFVVTDPVSVRWTGFIEAEFEEPYTFYVTSPDFVRLYIDDVLLVNGWGSVGLCSSSCAGQLNLTASPSGTALASRVFNHVRLEFKAFGRQVGSYVRPTGVQLEWSGLGGISRQVIAPDHLFKGLVIDNGIALKTVTVVADVFAGANTIVWFSVAPYIAGDAFAIHIQAQDAYGNNLLGDTARVFTATLTGAVTSSATSGTGIDGLYEIPITSTASGLLTISVADSIYGTVLSATSVTISAASAASQLGRPITVADNVVVDTDLVISFTVLDSGGYEVFGDTSLPNILVTASWTGDSVSDGILPEVETLLRLDRFSPTNSWSVDFQTGVSSFLFSELSWSSGAFHVHLRLPFAGAYTMTLGVKYGATATSITSSTATLSSSGTNVLLLASTTYSAATSIVISGVYSSVPAETDLAVPIAVTAGATVLATVQLRDVYMNCVTAPSVSPSSVTIGIQAYPPNACSDAGSGQYSCSFTPTVTGTNMYISVLVDGSQASLIYLTVTSVVKESLGPWLISVFPGDVDYSASTVTGIRPIYIAGQPVNAVITLRDASGNPIGAAPGTTPPLAVTIGSHAIDSGYSSRFNLDGTVTVPIAATVPGNAQALVITIDTTDTVTATWGSVSVLVGTVKASKTNCATWTAITVADLDSTSLTVGYQPLVCSPMDIESNSVTSRDHLVADGYCEATDLTVSTFPGVYTSGTYDYDTSIFYQNGIFSCYFLIGQPGGLIGQYYVGADLVGLDGTTGSVILDPRFVSAPFEYTQIDPYLSFNWGDGLTLGGNTVTSIVWTGVLVFPANDDYSFQVDAVGGVSVSVGETVWVSDLTSPSVSTSFTLSGQTEFDSVALIITLDFTTSVATPKTFTLQWEYSSDAFTGLTYWVVPSSVFQSPLSTEIGTVATSTITATNPSPYAFANAQDPTLLEAGVTYNLVVTLETAAGTARTSDESSCPSGSGTLFGCLFSVTTTGPSSNVIDAIGTVAGNTAGTYTIPVPIDSAYQGTATLHVFLLLNGASPQLNGGVPLALRIRQLSVQSTFVLTDPTTAVVNSGDTTSMSGTYTLTLTGNNSAGTARGIDETLCPGTGVAISSYPSSCLFGVSYDAGGGLTSVSSTANSGRNNGVYTITFQFSSAASGSLHVYLYGTSEELTSSPITLVSR